uniref:molybdopterin biosynthesis protein n=1 Tax=Dixoniella grisea TaxID=35153 RepID=UPI001FCD8A74|nr:molybdopterin biosynthesis protein [Dixoniella grisea]UNJ17190.1 molybdopterin biosynthesis protein [Dixoniella grisea]
MFEKTIMNKSITIEDLNRYAKHLSLSIIGVNGQQRINNAKVICIGAGGLASATLLYLCAAGIGNIGIIDNDYIELSNLHRQVIYNTYHINQLKIDCAKQELLKINPKCKIDTYNSILSHENSISIIKKYDIIIDCTDNIIVRYILSKNSLFLNKVIIYGAISQFHGQVGIFNFQGGSTYKDLYPFVPTIDLENNCISEGVLGILPGMIGIIQATEVMKIILGLRISLNNKLMICNSLNMKFREINIDSRYTSFQYYKWLVVDHNIIKNIVIHLEHKIPIISYAKYQDLRQKNKCQLCYIGYHKEIFFLDNNIIFTLSEIQFSINRLKELSCEKILILCCKTTIKSLLASIFLYKKNINTIVMDLTNVQMN